MASFVHARERESEAFENDPNVSLSQIDVDVLTVIYRYSYICNFASYHDNITLASKFEISSIITILLQQCQRKQESQATYSALYSTMSSVSATGLAGATATVIVTTLEDCVWLVPFVAHAPSVSVALIHAGIFVVTFELLALGISLVTFLLGGSLQGVLGLGDIVLGVAGALLCWILAAFLYLRARQKRREREALPSSSQSDVKGEYGSLEGSDSDPNPPTSDNGPDPSDDVQGAQPWMIVTLTILGSLDEVSYFPALILGGVFTAAELCLATLLSSLIILVVLHFFLTQCKPLLDVLDSIPLYGIVAFFAVMLSMEVVWELLQ
jgi:hypothetical protein